MFDVLAQLRAQLASIDPRMPMAVLAVAVGALIFAIKRLWPAGFARLPKDAQAYPALVLGAVLSALSGTGDPMAILSDALFGGLLGGVTSIGGHHAGKRLRERVRQMGASGGAALVLAIATGAAPILTSCDFLRSARDTVAPYVERYGPTVVDAAQMLCAGEYARQTGLSVEEVKEGVCSSAKAFEPFLEPALAAQRAGAARAGLAPPEGPGGS